MNCKNRCLVQIDYCNGLFFVDSRGQRTSNIQDALIFDDEYTAQLYIDKHGLTRLAKLRRIITRENSNHENSNGEETNGEKYGNNMHRKRRTE